MGQNSSADWVVGLLENKSKAHILNETSRSISNVETSEFDFMERGEQDNKAWQTFPDDLSKSEQHDPTQTKLSVYPWIEYSVKEDALFWSCWCFGEKRRFEFFYCLKIIKKLSTKYNGPRKTVFFCSDIN